MNYNIRLDVAVDEDNDWAHRKYFLVSQLKFYSPDIFGTQKVLPHQINYIKNELTDCNFIGVGKDGAHKGEFSVIFFNRNIFKVKRQSTFWLSTTLEKLPKGWDAAFIGICTYGLFSYRRTKGKIWVFNTRLDNERKIVRNNLLNSFSRRLRKSMSKAIPLLLWATLIKHQSNLISNLKNQMNDSKEISIAAPFRQDETFKGFEFNKAVIRRINYIMFLESTKAKVEKYAVLTDSMNMKNPTDHFWFL